MPDACVTIVIPVYNTDPQLLERAVESALVQQGLARIVLVDDGSREETACAVDALAARDERIRAVHKPNGGVSSARNRGLEELEGDFFCFMDADDVLELAFCTEALAALSESGADAVYGGVLHTGPGVAESLCGQPQLAPGEFVVLEGEGIDGLKGSLFSTEALPQLCGLAPAMYVSSYAALFRRSVLGQVRFDEQVVISEDRLFNYEVFCRAGKVALCGGLWYRYLANEGSASLRVRLRAAEELALTAERVEALAAREPGLAPYFDAGLLECYTQAVSFSVMRPGFRRACGMGTLAYLRRIHAQPVFTRLFERLTPPGRFWGLYARAVRAGQLWVVALALSGRRFLKRAAHALGRG